MKKAILIAVPVVLCLIIVGVSVSNEGVDVRRLKSGMASAAVPEIINYQGVLTDDTGAPLSTTVSMTFTIYNAETDGDVLWTEIHGFVTTFGGYFDVLLGSITPLPPTVFSARQVLTGHKNVKVPYRRFMDWCPFIDEWSLIHQQKQYPD